MRAWTKSGFSSVYIDKYKKIYATPAQAERVLEIDVVKGTSREAGPKIEKLMISCSKHEDAVYVEESNKVYAVPYCASNVLEINVANPATSKLMAENYQNVNANGIVGLYTTATYANSSGKIYAPPCDALSVLEIDPIQGTSRQLAESYEGGMKWTSATFVEATQKVYCPPRDHGQVLVIDTTDGTSELMNETYEDGARRSGSSSVRPSCDSCGDKYNSNGVHVAHRRNIYVPPCNAKRVLEINPDTGTSRQVGTDFSEQTCSFEALTPLACCKWLSAVHVPDVEKIFSPPCETNRVLLIDVNATGAIRTQLIGNDFGTGGGGKYATSVYVRAVQKNYSPPYRTSASKVLEIDVFTHATKLIGEAYDGDYKYLSAWFASAVGCGGY